jgi:hypothetical protein
MSEKRLFCDCHAGGRGFEPRPGRSSKSRSDGSCKQPDFLERLKCGKTIRAVDLVDRRNFEWCRTARRPRAERRRERKDKSRLRPLVAAERQSNQSSPVARGCVPASWPTRVR